MSRKIKTESRFANCNHSKDLHTDCGSDTCCALRGEACHWRNCLCLKYIESPPLTRQERGLVCQQWLLTQHYLHLIEECGFTQADIPRLAYFHYYVEPGFTYESKSIEEDYERLLNNGDLKGLQPWPWNSQR